jgi:peptidoglycan/LPS O-acetylase OafA/YrhL
MMDWLRGFAASWVALFHFNEVIPYQNNWWQLLCKPGHLGVPIFFVISGWCMATLADRNPPPGRFIAARFVRILIPFWASMLVVLGVVGLHVLFWGQNDVTKLPKTALAVVVSVIVGTEPVTSLPGINWVYWSLSYELVFYLVVAFGLLLRRITLLLILLLPLALAGGGLHRWDLVEGVSALRPFFWVNHFPLFCLGYFLCIYRIHGRISQLCFAFVSAVIAFNTEIVAVFGVGAATAALLFPRWSAGWMPVLWDRAMSAVGRWSYSLYLIHVPIGVYLFGCLRNEWVLKNQITHALFDLTNLAVCILTAAIFHRWIEQPSLRLARLISKQGLVASLWKIAHSKG